MSRKAIWLTLTLSLLTLTACTLADLSRFVPLTATPTPGASPLPTETATATPSPTPWAQPAASRGETATRRAVVCTGYAEGALNVRTCPGVGCWAFFPLTEGQAVTLDGQEAQTEDGATWAHIIQPVDGWVNAKYLCEEKP